VTEQRRLEERLKRAEKMEALGTMAGGIAHDFNNILGIVVGYAELLLTEVQEPGRLRSGLQNILGSGEKAAAIVQDLLTLARRGVYNRSVIYLNQIVREVQQSPSTKSSGPHHPRVEIRSQLDPDS
jgi:signal transduction histidine kinase